MDEDVVNLREVGGACGQEVSTIRGREGARNFFDAYPIKRKLPKFDILIEIEEQICSQSNLVLF